MKTLFDVQNLLKRFGTFIYTGDRSADLDLIQGELQELYQSGLIQSEEFRIGILIIRREQAKYKNIH